MTTKLEKDRWANRRKMAWIALWALIAMGAATLVVALIKPEAATASGMVVSAIAVSLAGIVGAYVGFATADDKWKQGETP